MKQRQQFQNMLDSLFQRKFQESDSSFSVSQIQNEQSSVLELSIELLRESERQTQNLIDSQLHHNFQNQTPYSPFQKNPISQSMEDIIQTQHMVTQSIHAQESQLANTIAYTNEETQPYQSLTDFNIPCPIDVTQVSYHFENQDLISSYQPELDQNQILDILAS